MRTAGTTTGRGTARDGAGDGDRDQLRARDHGASVVIFSTANEKSSYRVSAGTRAYSIAQAGIDNARGPALDRERRPGELAP